MKHGYHSERKLLKTYKKGGIEWKIGGYRINQGVHSIHHTLAKDGTWRRNLER